MKDKSLKISGKVIRGDNFGKKLGFPTANLDRREYIKNKLKIKFGVWAGFAELSSRPKRRDLLIIKNNRFLSLGSARDRNDKKRYKAGIVIGPLDKHHLPKIEAHLIGFTGNLYGRKLTLHLHKYLRPFKKFKDSKDLKIQIQKDIKIINNMSFLRKQES